jgi:DNA polymerase III alpha subunit
MRIRTGYSFRAAVGHLKSVMARLKECEYPVAPISDRASTFGFVKWRKLCQKEGMRPIFGVELGVTASLNAKKLTVDYWTFFAKDSLVPLNVLFELATKQFRYEPQITYQQAMEAEGLIKIVGHRSLLDQFKPQKDLYVGLSPSASRAYIAAALKAKHRLIATGDNKYTNHDDAGLYETVLGSRNASLQTYPQHILTNEEWRDAVAAKVDTKAAAAAYRNREAAFKQCNADLVVGELLVPDKPLTLKKMCEVGAKRLGCDLKDKVYAARLKRELELIADKQFEDYFYIIADVVEWARARMLVGPARGSSCGSLVCYLLGITTVDPIPYGLIFERFIDVNRNDLPDIDIDFSDQRRQQVFDYMAKKYGQDRVARLGTVAMYKPRSAISEAGAALQVPKWKFEQVMESIIERSSGDARALQSIADTMNDTVAGRELISQYPEILISAKMEGHPRHYSQHAAGIILTQKPVNNYVAVDYRTGATQCDKKDAEELNLLKIDALGLTQLSVFEDALEMAGLDRLTLEHIPLDDQAAFDVINKGQFSGIFQYNGVVLQNLAKQFTTDELEDIISVTALARPGPLTSGGASTWVSRKAGKQPVAYPHPLFEPYLSNSLGVVIYQEQVMEIARHIGGLSWEDVTALRKAMSKSLGKEYFDQYGDRFKAGAVARGIPLDLTTKIWDDMCAYGAWAFNRSHSVAYGLISYQCCWLKAHYPFEFAAATLSHETEPEKQIKTLREMDKEGFGYVPVDAEHSIDRWTTGYVDGKKVLLGPVNNVKGIGPKMVSAIVSSRKRGEPLPSRAAKLLANPKTAIDSLWPIRDAVRRIMPDPTARNIYTEPTAIEDMQIQPHDQDFLAFCTVARLNLRNENEVVNVVKRGGKEYTDGLYTSLNLQLQDDTDIIFGKINRFKFPEMGQAVVDRGSPGKVLYAVKGRMRGGFTFRMLNITAIRFIGMMDDPAPTPATEGEVK